jgi:type I restriction-modification system DNA methylase subunit
LCNALLKAVSGGKNKVMRTILLPLLFTLWASCLLAQEKNTVNAVLGDESFVQAFQQLPDDNTNEVLRLQTHLSYVESLLRSKPTTHLNSQQKEKRELALQLLHRYWNNGVFPRNYEYTERRPCFIDRDGNICAVGYLIEKTVGREVAEEINQKHQYNYLLEMNEPVIE